MIAGALASRRPWREKFGRLEIPVFTTVAAKGAVDETANCSAGIFTNCGGRFTPEAKILPIADLAIGLGLRTTEIIDIKGLPIPLVILDELEGTIGGLEAATAAVVSSAAFEDALDILQTKAWGLAAVAAAKRDLEERLDLSRWLPSASLRIAQNVLPEATVFVLDTGNFCTIGEHVLMAKRPLQVMGSALGRSMGVGIPNGVGAALAHRAIPHVIVVGDGGVRMYPESITIAVREKLPIVVLMMSDGFYSSVRQAAVARGYSQRDLCLDSSCWTNVFETFGCAAERIESCIGLESALRKWNVGNGPLFLELAYDADAYMAMTEGIR